MSNLRFGSRSEENLLMVEKDTDRLCRLALEYTTQDFSIIDGFRTADEQSKLYSKGVTELDGINKLSAHQSGLAIDIIPYASGVDIWNTSNDKVKALWLEVYRAFMRAGMKLNLRLEFGLGYNIGGGRDYPHIQIIR